jgi:hypothetical protein
VILTGWQMQQPCWLCILLLTSICNLPLFCSADTGRKASHAGFPPPGSDQTAGRIANDGPDVVILHPRDEAELAVNDTLVVAAYISAFCVERLGKDLLGIQLFLNGILAVQEPLQVHGNDGNAQYHIFVPNLHPGQYDLVAVPWAPEQDVDDALVSIKVLSQEEHDHKTKESRSHDMPKNMLKCWGSTEHDWIGRFTNCEIGAPARETEEWCNTSCSETQQSESGSPSCSNLCAGHGLRLGADECVCNGDWFGEDCTHDVYSSAVHLPAKLHASCLESHRWLKAANLLEVS